ncbi:MAG: UDP-glucose/GDP-mannose dehydrogenase family protein [Clostridia bacterium]|nr:UDP-glucose/GDP-mannose dehydrogenase family protein [Clostridia bacterium]
MKITVAGTGYVGLVTAVCFADKGHDVTCVDIDAGKIDMLNNGIAPIFEEGLEELMSKNSSRLTYTTDYKSAYKDSDIIFIGVGTPERRDSSADLSFVNSVAMQIAQTAEKNCIMVIKSTVPVGTNANIEQMIADRLKPGVHIEVVSNPEFLAQGTAVRDTLHPSRIIIGTENAEAEAVMREVYDGFDAPILVMDRESAEMVKYASNDFLALKISYINEIANLCEIVGADIESVSKGMGFDTRIGSSFLRAGIGYGGSCFPKDTKALHWLAHINDCEIKTIKAAIEVNEKQKLSLYRKSKKYTDSLDGKTVAVLGLTFKPGTDDLREAPSLVNIPIFLEDGAKINAWDPAGTEKFRELFPEINYCDSIDKAITNADICFIFTEWNEVCSYQPSEFVRLMKTPIVLDGRNCIDKSAYTTEGLIYEGIGKGKINKKLY